MTKLFSIIDGPVESLNYYVLFSSVYFCQNDRIMCSELSRPEVFDWAVNFVSCSSDIANHTVLVFCT